MKSISVFRKVAMSIAISLIFLLGLEIILTTINFPDIGIYRGDPNHVWWLRTNLERQVLHIEEKQHFCAHLCSSFNFLNTKKILEWRRFKNVSSPLSKPF